MPEGMQAGESHCIYTTEFKENLYPLRQVMHPIDNVVYHMW
jgi:hypothetical protein